MSTWYHIVKLADGQIRDRGYNAFSYGDLSGVMRVSSAAIHHHFRSKSDLGVEVVRQELMRVNKYRKFYGNLPGEEQLKYLVTKFYRNWQQKNICLMGSLMPDFATFDPAMQRAVQNLSRSIEEWVTDLLERGRREGGIRFEGGASDRALLVISTLMSSLLMARVHGGAVFERMVDQLLKDLGVSWRISEIGELETGELETGLADQ